MPSLFSSVFIGLCLVFIDAFMFSQRVGSFFIWLFKRDVTSLCVFIEHERRAGPQVQAGEIYWLLTIRISIIYLCFSPGQTAFSFVEI